jgi:hypothetical protein
MIMMHSARIAAILSAGLCSGAALAQSNSQPFQPFAQPNQITTQPQTSRPAPAGPAMGVPAAIPGPRLGGGGGGAGGGGSTVFGPPPSTQIPIVQKPGVPTTPSAPAASTPQAPAPKDGSTGPARLSRQPGDGGGDPGHDHDHNHDHVHLPIYYPWYGYGYGYYGPSYYYDPYSMVGTQQNFIVDPRLLAPQPVQPQAQVPTHPPTPMEIAEYALRIGDTTEAAKQLKIHLKKNPDDAAAERMLAMALLDDRKVDKAVAVLLHAYTKQPTLARDPIDPHSLSGYELDHHQRFTRVMTYANRTKLGSAFLAASVLAQSEGRFDVSKKLLDRAIAEGIDKKVADEMTMALTNP